MSKTANTTDPFAYIAYDGVIIFRYFRAVLDTPGVHPNPDNHPGNLEWHAACITAFDRLHMESAKVSDNPLAFLEGGAHAAMDQLQIADPNVRAAAIEAGKNVLRSEKVLNDAPAAQTGSENKPPSVMEKFFGTASDVLAGKRK